MPQNRKINERRTTHVPASQVGQVAEQNAESFRQTLHRGISKKVRSRRIKNYLITGQKFQTDGGIPETPIPTKSAKEIEIERQIEVLKTERTRIESRIEVIGEEIRQYNIMINGNYLTFVERTEALQEQQRQLNLQMAYKKKLPLNDKKIRDLKKLLQRTRFRPRRLEFSDE